MPFLIFFFFFLFASNLFCMDSRLQVVVSEDDNVSGKCADTSSSSPLEGEDVVPSSHIFKDLEAVRVFMALVIDPDGNKAALGIVRYLNFLENADYLVNFKFIKSQLKNCLKEPRSEKTVEEKNMINSALNAIVDHIDKIIEKNKKAARRQFMDSSQLSSPTSSPVSSSLKDRMPPKTYCALIEAHQQQLD